MTSLEIKEELSRGSLVLGLNVFMNVHFWLCVCCVWFSLSQGCTSCLCACTISHFSHVWLFETPWTAVCQPSLSLTISRSLPKSIALVMPCTPLILWHPLLLLPSNFPSIRDFSNGSTVCIRWPEYLSFSSSISPSNEYSELISLKIDGLDFLAVSGQQGILKTLLQYQFEGINSSALPFFTAQLSQIYVATGKTVALTLQTFVSRVMSLLFNTLSTFFIAILPRNKHMISWLPSPSAVILELKNRKSVTLPPFLPLFAMK